MIRSRDILERACRYARNGTQVRLALSRAAAEIEDRRRSEFVQAQATAIETIDHLVARAAREQVEPLALLKLELSGTLPLEAEVVPHITAAQADDMRRVLTGVGRILRETDA